MKLFRIFFAFVLGYLAFVMASFGSDLKVVWKCSGLQPSIGDSIEILKKTGTVKAGDYETYVAITTFDTGFLVGTNPVTTVFQPSYDAHSNEFRDHNFVLTLGDKAHTKTSYLNSFGGVQEVQVDADLACVAQ